MENPQETGDQARGERDKGIASDHEAGSPLADGKYCIHLGFQWGSLE